MYVNFFSKECQYHCFFSSNTFCCVTSFFKTEPSIASRFRLGYISYLIHAYGTNKSSFSSSSTTKRRLWFVILTSKVLEALNWEFLTKTFLIPMSGYSSSTHNIREVYLYTNVRFSATGRCLIKTVVSILSWLFLLWFNNRTSRMI